MNIVGIGPGSIRLLTKEAYEAINKSSVVVGYKTYSRLLGSLLKDKEVYSFGMGQEVERVKTAINKALEGKIVSLISGGDPGIYGMAGLALELLDRGIDIKIEIISGIPALLSCAALLGAPLMHDFAVISLSDLLTDIRLIEERLKSALFGDFVIVLYNPSSRKRRRPWESALRILLSHRSLDTPVGIVWNAKRRNEEVLITTLKKLPSFDGIDMKTTIIVGNSKTYVKGKYMITPRGYLIEGDGSLPFRNKS